MNKLIVPATILATGMVAAVAWSQSPSQFRPAGPPPLTSARYAADFNEVKAIGNAPTPAQAATANFWANAPVTGVWDDVADQLAQAHDLGLAADARLLARLNIALADSAIAIWDAKNHFDTWRPITAIAHADTDGNPDTTAQPGWTPLLPTPPRAKPKPEIRVPRAK